MIYRTLYKVILSRVDPELAHRAAVLLVNSIRLLPGARTLLRRLFAASDPALEVQTLGMTFAGPIGAAAGMDKNAAWFDGLLDLGFGFAEVGTVTATPQTGNPRRRIWRLNSDRAFINSMGFPNHGAKATARLLACRDSPGVVGVNVGKSMAVAPEAAVADYLATLDEVGPLSDYIVINVSSPNTAGLRDLQAIEPLRALLNASRDRLAESGRHVPLLVKISPDLPDEQIDEIADLAVEVGLDGIVAINTTTNRDGLHLPRDPDARSKGGVSGAPIKRRAVEVLARLRARVGDKLVLVSVGGVENADDVWCRLMAGASLVQAHTGFIYGGPLWPARVNREIARRVHEAGASSVQELIGSDVRSAEPHAQQKPVLALSGVGSASLSAGRA